LKQFDIQLLKWCADNGLASHILLTKRDKLKSGASKEAFFKIEGWLKEHGYKTTVQLFSSLKNEGVGELHGVLDGWFEV